MDRVSRIALDVDGTIAGYGGIIDKWAINEFLKTAHVGIVSSRGDCHDIARDLGLGYACCAGVDKPSKADCLRDYASKYPVPGGSLYIADLESDFQSAKDAGWNYADVNHICVNLGSGEDIREGCINIDARILSKVDIVRNLEVDPIPLPDNSIEKAILQDFLEHISWRKVLDFVRQVYAKMKSGGSVFIQTPEIENIYNAVIKDKFFKGDFKYRFEAISYWVGGGQDYIENTHKSFWDKNAMVELLSSVGFIDVSCVDAGTNMICTARKQ